MENYKNDIYDRVIVNYDHDFVENDDNGATASYVILCEFDAQNDFSKPIYDLNVLGLSFYDWVAMACDTKPARVHTSKDEKFINLIKPYMGGFDYTVVLYADTPLVSKSHLKDLIGFVSRKGLNVCKLKRGYILKNEYVSEVEDIYSSLVYDLSSNDFMQVKSLSDFDNVKDILEKRIFNHFKKNGVTFSNQNTTTIDANVSISSGCVIGGNVSIINNSTIGENVIIETGAVVSNSKIENNAIIGTGANVSSSVVKTGAEIKTDSSVVSSVLGQNSKVGIGSRVVKSAINDFAKVDDFVNLKNVNVLNGATVGAGSIIIGDGVVVAIEEDSTINAGTKLVKKNNQ
ncbi:MAG: hypothetical protein IJX17_07335 [Clostridia bacterium]|nr:hypothetical protein [Clostridia bacterium]